MSFNIHDLKWCQNCLAMSTRPRIKFDNRGWCNACVWSEKKKTIDWTKREEILTKLLDQHRQKDNTIDCLVPCSGGKDGSYVAWNLKHKYGMNPLAITVNPHLPLKTGDINLKNFLKSGFNHIAITPSYHAMQTLNKIGFIEMGSPYFGWLTSILSAVTKMANQLRIGLIFYGEDGEVEYGGSTETDNDPIYGINYMKRVYLEGGYQKILDSSNLSQEDLYFFKFPSDDEISSNPIKMAHWSYFENWNPYKNYLLAKEKCGLQENADSNEGTFTNFAQNDQELCALHYYLMYLKFGFGRGNQDASIEIRRGAMDREQAVNLVRLYDGQYPEKYLKSYLNYFQMSLEEFDSYIDKWANKALFKKENGRWTPLFEVH